MSERDITDKLEMIALNKSPGVDVHSAGDRIIMFDAIAEIKRLREALADMARDYSVHLYVRWGDDGVKNSEVMQRARALLDGKE